MIQRVTRHNGYIEVLNENGQKHLVVDSSAQLIGWSRESYAVRFGSASQIMVYDGAQNRLGNIYVAPEWRELMWDGHWFTYRYENNYYTVDLNGNRGPMRPV